MRRTAIRFSPALCCLLLALAACSQVAQQPTAGPVSPTDMPTLATQAVIPTDMPALPTQAVIPTAAPTVLATEATAGIPRGKTVEGYNYLGKADAKVTMVMYSDFF